VTGRAALGRQFSDTYLKIVRTGGACGAQQHAGNQRGPRRTAHRASFESVSTH
jgi:hypothetical protein